MAGPSHEPGDGQIHASGTGSQPGLWRLFAATLLFLTFAPIGMVAAPTAALLVRSGPRRPSEMVALAVTGAISLGWLLNVGTLPDQVLRACVVVATAVFVLAAAVMPAVPHRALLAIGSALVLVGAMFPIFGISWDELHWWVEHGAGQSARALLAVLWATTPTTPDGVPTSQSLAARAEEWLAGSVQFMADYYPAIIAIQLCMGMALATAAYYRMTDHPVGDAFGRIRDFRFSEHLGWIAILPLLLALVPAPATAKLIAVNVLLVMATFYALRGVGVVIYAVSRYEGGRGFATAMALLAAILLLPIAVAGVILLGVVDARLDFRARWPSKPHTSH